MIPDLVYTSKNFYDTFNQVRFRFICLLLGLNAIGLNTINFCYIVNTPTNQVNICTKEKS